MRTFKYTAILWVFVFSPMAAQMKIDKHINFAGKESIILNIQIADSIDIHTWNKDEVFATASVNINENKDNEAYLTSFDVSGSTVNIKAEFKDSYFHGRNDCCIRSSITWDVYIPENTEFSVETINGNITIDGKTTEMNVKTISGFIDLKVPADRSADLEMKTISGTFYSDLNISSGIKDNGIPSVIRQKLNNGGDEVTLETISGDIFFRKSN